MTNKQIKYLKIKKENLNDSYDSTYDWIIYCDDGSTWVTDNNGTPIQMGNSNGGEGIPGPQGPPGNDGKDFVVVSNVEFSCDYGNLDNIIEYPKDNIKPTVSMITAHTYWAISKMSETSMRFIGSAKPLIFANSDDGAKTVVKATSGNITSYTNATGEWVSGSFASSTSIGIINCNHTIENQATGGVIEPRISQQQMRGSTSQINNYAGNSGQIVVNTDTNAIHVMDGVTKGGHIVGSSNSEPKLDIDVLNYLKYTGAIPPDYYLNYNIANTPTDSAQRWEYMGFIIETTCTVWLNALIPIAYEQDRAGELKIYECFSKSEKFEDWTEIYSSNINIPSSSSDEIILENGPVLLSPKCTYLFFLKIPNYANIQTKYVETGANPYIWITVNTASIRSTELSTISYTGLGAYNIEKLKISVAKL